MIDDAQIVFGEASVGFFLFLYVWVRWTIPRFRFDQLMGLSWKWFLNLALLNLFVTGLIQAWSSRS